MNRQTGRTALGFTVRRAAALCALAVGLGALASSATGAAEIALKKVPAVVRAAADKAVPEAKWASASKETEDDKEFWYELEGKDAKGRNVHVSISEGGKVDEVSTEIASKDAPKVVTDALSAKFPKFKIETSYEIVKDGKIDRYDFEGKRPRDKEEITVSVSPDGKKVEVDE